MALPITPPYTFANATTTQNLSYLDSDFATVYNTVNGIGNGTVSLSNVSITGGNIAASYSANSISIASLQTTGTANSTTYLRGDGSWATVSGGGGNGTVTSVNANSTVSGFTFTGGPITSSGTLTLTGPSPGTSGNVLTSNGTSWVSGTVSTPQGAKAWCNFNGTSAGPITPRSSYNVSSVTKNGTGDYTVNYTNALSDANYSGVVSGRRSTSSIPDPNYWAGPYPTTTPNTNYPFTTTTARIFSAIPSNGSGTDSDCMNFVVFGN